jgi:hypothetical protein
VYAPSKELSAALVVLNDAHQGINQSRRWTFGPHFTWNYSGFNGFAEAYYQAGQAAKNVDYDAYFVGTHLGYTFAVETSPYIGLIADDYSGDKKAGDKKVKTFDSLFATGHKWLGYMDIFLNLPKDTSNLGVLDVGLSLMDKPTKTLSLQLDVHSFQTNVKSPGGNTSWGQETDFIANYTAWEAVKFGGGLCLFFPGDAMKEFRGKKSETYGFLQTTIKL